MGNEIFWNCGIDNNYYPDSSCRRSGRPITIVNNVNNIDMSAYIGNENIRREGCESCILCSSYVSGMKWRFSNKKLLNHKSE